MTDATPYHYQNEASAPAPTVKAEFHVEPHPDPIVRALIEEVELLRRENHRLQARLILFGDQQNHGADPR